MLILEFGTADVFETVGHDMVVFFHQPVDVILLIRCQVCTQSVGFVAFLESAVGEVHLLSFSTVDKSPG